MDFKKEFAALAQKKNLSYQFQEFKNCFGGDWVVWTYSLYNDSGCFTVSYWTQREEVDFYYAEKFSTDRKELCAKPINVFEAEQEIWRKNKRIWIFNNPFFYCSPKRIIKALIEVINSLIEKNNEFFGIKL